MKRKHCFCLQLASVGVPVKIFKLGLDVLLIFGWTLAKFELSARTANKTCLNHSMLQFLWLSLL